jgi:hypothetical protein
MNLLLSSLRSLLLVAAIAFVVVACKKDKEPEPTPTGMKGNWSIKSVGLNPGIPAIDPIITELNSGPCSSKISLAFSDAGNVSYSAPTECLQSILFLGQIIGPNSKWEVKNDKLFLTNDEGNYEFDMTFNGSDVTLVSSITVSVFSTTATLVLTRK